MKKITFQASNRVDDIFEKDFLMSDHLNGSLSETERELQRAKEVRTTLEKFERSKILEVYFCRLDSRIPEEIPFEYEELYEIGLDEIKSFLLGQHPQDPILQKIFRMMS